MGEFNPFYQKNATKYRDVSDTRYLHFQRRLVNMTRPDRIAQMSMELKGKMRGCVSENVMFLQWGELRKRGA